MYSLALYRFNIPGEAGFPLNSVYAKPSSPGEAGNLVQFVLKIYEIKELYRIFIVILYL